MDKQVITVSSRQEGKRLDSILAAVIEGISRSGIQRLIEEGEVTTNGNVQSKNYRVKTGDIIEVNIPEPKPLSIAPQDIPLDIVYEDSEVIVVNKPAGMVVHPAAGNSDNTLVNALLCHCGDSLSGINGVIRPGIVHRIDKDTAGLLLVAKTNEAHLSLAAQIKEHFVKRIYEAVALGNLKQDSMTIDAPIGRHKLKRKQMTVTNIASRNAITHVEVIERLKGCTHVRCKLETGRTHQIRVHMAYIGHPLIGDPVYGINKKGEINDGQLLCAKTIGFNHPKTGEYMEFSCELPKRIKDYISKHNNR